MITRITLKKCRAINAKHEAALCYDMIFIDCSFYQVTVVGQLVQKWVTDSYIEKEKQHTKPYQNTEYSK